MKSKNKVITPTKKKRKVIKKMKRHDKNERGHWTVRPHLSSYPPGSAPDHKLQSHAKSLAYFSHLAPLNLFFFIKRQSQKGGGGAWHNVPLKHAPVGRVHSKMIKIMHYLKISAYHCFAELEGLASMLIILLK